MDKTAPADAEQSMNLGNEISRPYTQAAAAGSYAFLNHSSMTLPRDLPPSVDDKPLARQKRRRTSPEDQAILEAAYNHDSKPDKVARLELVKQVALGEKEVQIWFQNRRQTSRRKSRPLLPHEIAQYHLARSGYPQLPIETSEDDVPNAYSIDAETVDRHVDASSSPALSQSYSTGDSMVSSGTISQSGIAGDVAAMPLDNRAPVGYLANRRSAPSLRPDAPIEGHLLPLSSWSRHVASTQRKSSSSTVRLSLTGDGKAEIVTKNGSSPSPPRPPQLLTEFFEKTTGPQSASQETGPSHNHTEPRALHRSSSGRASDSRTWQFWCDKEARNELETKAEKDASGSAADAIDLLRSTSGRRVLGALSSRKNNVLSRHTSFVQRKSLGAKPPSLPKSSTSLGRLQSGSKTSGNGMASMYKAGGDVRIPGNESDKENWSPRSYEHSESSAEGYTASANENPRSKFSDMQNSTDKTEHSTSNRQDISNGKENRIHPEALTKGGNKANSLSAAEDLDCIQGLLSLSQGNWR